MEETLDFTDLLERAHLNNEVNRENHVRRYDADLRGKKKAENQSLVDPRAVQRLLAKQKREEIRKRNEERQKKERLMAERANNRKATGRISSMLKRTKSAMKGAVNQEEALAAASDNLEADDFGYTSTYADKLHEKLLKKYEDRPVRDIFSKGKKLPAGNLEATKARMKEALEHGDEELPASPVKRSKSKSSDSGDKHDDDFSRNDAGKSEKDREKELERQRRKERAAKAPPPVSYEALLNLASTTKKEVMKFNPLEIAPKLKQEYEFDRPMTAKEKEEYKRELEAKLRREGKLPRKPAPAPAPKVEESNVQPAAKKLGPIPKIASASTEKKSVPDMSNLKKIVPKQNVNKLSEESARKLTVKTEKPVFRKPSNISAPSSSKKPAEPYVPQRVTEEYVPKPVTGTYVPKLVTGTYVPKPVGGKDPSASSASYKATKIVPKSGPSTSSAPKPGPASKTGKPVAGGSSASNSKQVRPGQPSQSVQKQLKPGGGSNAHQVSNIKPKIGEKRPAGADPWSRLQGDRMAAKKSKPAPPPRRRIESDSEEEEYDSELEDFIDDGPLEGEPDFSSEISKIFGYDRRRYADLDDEDDECMEASYSEQMKEEFRSTKAGILEDLREARLEKMRKKKALGKGGRS